jgi:hypothetical protein
MTEQITGLRIDFFSLRVRVELEDRLFDIFIMHMPYQPDGPPRKVRLYILTSSISPEDIAHASEYPLISGYLIKPIDKEKMAEIVSST